MTFRKKWLGMLAILTVILLLPGVQPVRAATSQEIQEQIDQLEQEDLEIQAEIDRLEALLSDNLEQIGQIVDQKNAIDLQISLLNQRIANTNTQIQAYGQLVADQQDILDEAEAALEALNRKYKERIRAMEEQGTISYWQVLFRASSFTDFLDRLNMIQEIADADARRLDELQAAATAVDEAKAALEAEKEALEQLRLELQEAQLLLEEKRAESDALLQELIAQGEAFEALLEESEAKQEHLMAELAQAKDDYDEALYLEWLATYVPPKENDTTVDIPADSSDWITPVSGYVLTSPFGMRMHPILGYARMHNGVDLACPGGTPIYASRGGLVEIAAFQDGGAGNYVQINHGDGFRSIYMHMTNYVVYTGDYVAPGQLIGYVGNTGLSKGDHLHFGISYNGKYVNPMEYIG